MPLEQAAETLQGLRARGLRTAVVSNADGRVEALLRAAGLGAHLELVVDSHYEGIEKPDPEIFRRALARMGVRAERAVYVGDIYSIDVVGRAGRRPLADPDRRAGRLSRRRLPADRSAWASCSTTSREGRNVEAA